MCIIDSSVENTMQRYSAMLGFSFWVVLTGLSKVSHQVSVLLCAKGSAFLQLPHASNQWCFLWSPHQASHTTEEPRQVLQPLFVCPKLMSTIRTGTCGHDNARDLPGILCKLDLLVKGVWKPTQMLRWMKKYVTNTRAACALDHSLWNLDLWLRRQYLYFSLYLALGPT